MSKNQHDLDQRDYWNEIDDLVHVHKNAEGPLMKLANFAGSKIDSVFDKAPEGLEDKLQEIIKNSLELAFDVSNKVTSSDYMPNAPRHFHKIAATFSGAIGGVGGVVTSVAELPVVIATMFASFQSIAEEHGFDRNSHEIRMECLKVFTMGGPIQTDDNIDMSFVSARIGLTSEVVKKLVAETFPSKLITTASQKLTAMIGQKLGAQVAPMLGALTGATLNYTFVSYYEQMAHIRFRLKKLQNENPSSDPVRDFLDKIKESYKMKESKS